MSAGIFFLDSVPRIHFSKVYLYLYIFSRSPLLLFFFPMRVTVGIRKNITDVYWLCVGLYEICHCDPVVIQAVTGTFVLSFKRVHTDSQIIERDNLGWGRVGVERFELLSNVCGYVGFSDFSNFWIASSHTTCCICVCFKDYPVCQSYKTKCVNIKPLRLCH